MKRLLLGVMIFLSFSGLSAALPITKAYACSCAAPPSVHEAVQQSAAVFSGKVISIQEKQGLIFSSADPVTVTLSVKRIWKGEPAQESRVLTALSEASCGYGFQPNKDYLVYAGQDDEGRLVTTLCSRTKPLSAAADDLAALGAGKAPDVSGTAASLSGAGATTPMRPVYLAAVFGVSVCIVYLLAAISYGGTRTRAHGLQLPESSHLPEEEASSPRKRPSGRSLPLLLFSLAAAGALTWLVSLLVG